MFSGCKSGDGNGKHSGDPARSKNCKIEDNNPFYSGQGANSKHTELLLVVNDNNDAAESFHKYGEKEGS